MSFEKLVVQSCARVPGRKKGLVGTLFSRSCSQTPKLMLGVLETHVEQETRVEQVPRSHFENGAFLFKQDYKI